MRPSRFFWSLIGLFAAGLFALSWHLIFNGSGRISRAKFERIRIGMTKDELDELLGSENASPHLGNLLLRQTYSEDDGTRIMPSNVIFVEYGYPGGSCVVRRKEYYPWTVRDGWPLLDHHPWTVKDLCLRTRARLGW